VPLATLWRVLQIIKAGNQVGADIADGGFQFTHPAMPLCQWRDICGYRLK